MPRAMLDHAQLPPAFWAEAIATATELRNVTATRSNNDRTPLVFTVWTSTGLLSSRFISILYRRNFGLECTRRVNSVLSRKFTEKVRSLEPVLDDVAALENTHVSFTFLKFCLSVCELDYQLRVTPPDSTITGATLLDGLIQKYLDGSWVAHWTQLFSRSCSSQLPRVLTIRILLSGLLKPQTQPQPISLRLLRPVTSLRVWH